MNNISDSRNRRVLVIDDNRSIHEDFCKILHPVSATAEALAATTNALYGISKRTNERTLFELTAVYQGEEGVLLAKKALAEGLPFAMAFIDVRMPPGLDGVETTQKIWAIDPDIQIVLCTAFSDYSWDEMFRKLGHSDGLVILKKPFDTVEALQLAHALTEKWWLHQESRRRVEDLESRVGERTRELQRTNLILQTEVFEHKRAEVALRASEERFRALFELGPVAVYTCDTTGKIQEFNRRAADLWGRQPVLSDANERFCGAHELYRADGTALPHEECPMAEVVNGKIPHASDQEIFMDRPDGSRIAVMVNIVSLKNGDGEITGAINCFHDITDRKRSEDELRTAHRQIQRLIEHSPAVIYSLKVEGERVIPHVVSENITRLVGFTAGEARSFEWWEAQLHPEDRERVLAGIPETLQKGALTSEYRIKCKDGRYIWIEDNRLVVRDAGESPVEIVGVWTDVTDRKKLEDEVALRERRLNSFFTGAVAGLALLDENLRFVQVNATLAAMNGPSPEEHVGRTLREVIPDLAPMVEPMLQRILATGEAILNYEISGETPIQPGVLRTWMESLFPIAGKDGKPVGVGAIVVEITERKRAEEAVRESEARFRQLAENVNEVFWITDPDKETMLYISPAYERIWCRSCASLYSAPQSWMDAIHPKDRSRVMEAAASKQILGTYDEKYRILQVGGMTRWIHDRAFPVRDVHGQVYRIVGVAEDITDRKHAELRSEVQFLVTSALAAAAPLPETMKKIIETICRHLEWDIGEMWQLDKKSKVLRCVELWHPPSTEFLEFAAASRAMIYLMEEGLPGQVWASGETIWCPDVTQHASSIRHMATAKFGLRGAICFPIKFRGEFMGAMEFFSTGVREPDGELLAMSAALGTQIGQFIERRQLEMQFLQAQKMEAIGTLAGGIAHDFNNLLAAINGYTELARMASNDNAEVAECLDCVMKASGRATDLVRQILAFSRRQEQNRGCTQLRHVAAEALKLLRSTIPSTIKFKLSLAGNAPTVLADASQIHQVIMNLCTNAAHAMKNIPGRLSVKLDRINVDTDLAEAHPGLFPGVYALLSVSDTGTGMDKEMIDHIFEPFFTTKAAGEGTGLGLSVVHGIMQGHDGIITVYSQPGEGTTFNLYFPAYTGELLEATKESTEIPRGNGERILIVDDEETLVRMGKKMLERLGYLAEFQTNVKVALAAVREEPGRWDLIVTDLTMPEMTGLDFARSLLQIRPDLPIILNTGYSATVTEENVHAFGIREMLIKPLAIDVLGRAVHRALATRQKL